MPVTYNGIGTRYSGKKNVQQRPGQCRSCNRNVQLTSYDTRLWFVILFIPIIPLGRKRIVDSCPACRRHYVVNLDKWETARQLEISGAMEKFRGDPTAENAIAAHRQLLEFHQTAGAEEFQQKMLAQFPENAKVYVYLGAAQEHLGRQTEAAEFYGQALKLRPDLPEARIGVAQAYIRAGRLDEARGLLDFMEKPGAAQLYSLGPVETLARAYQAAGRHREALELFSKLIGELPKITEHAGFRKTVKISEKALGQRDSILPKLKFSFKRLFAGGGGNAGRSIGSKRALIVLGVVLALVILGFMISNEYIRRHRKLYLVNAFKAPATVEIAGVGSVKNFHGVQTIVLPEGHFHAVISGAKAEELDFDVRDTYFNRAFGDSLWLINVGGAALLEQVSATYSRNPQPPAISFHTGMTFEHLPRVTHPFETLPKSVEVDAGGSKTLVGLDWFSGDASDVFEYYLGKRNTSAALEFGERWLHGHPEDDTMLQLYGSTAGQANSNRLDVFLRAGLTNRPVQIQWHRFYQDLHKGPAERPELTAKYDELLRAEPKSSAFLYLRGRLETNRTTARAYFTDAAAADPQNPFPTYALGYDRAAAGDWAGAAALVAKAAALNTRDPGIANLFLLARLAQGEAPQIEKEAREKLAREPLNYSAETQLLDALVAQDKNADATKACNEYVKECNRKYGTQGAELIRTTRYHGYYVTGDFAQLKALAATDASIVGHARLAMALIELGEADEAAKVFSADRDLAESETLPFALAVAYRLNGNEASAAQWEARGIEALERQGSDAGEAGELLKRGSPPTRAEAENLAMSAQNKAVILTMLAQQYPQSRGELAGLARQLNVGREFPHHLVSRATAP